MNAVSSLKRLKPELERHPTYYFDDGNIVLAFEHDNVMFKLYRGLLAHHSQVFYDMLSLPQVQVQPSLALFTSSTPNHTPSRSGSGTPRVYEDCQETADAGPKVPVVCMTDKASDFTHLLDVIMGITPERPSMDMIEGALRISGKYMFDGVRAWSIGHLTERLPTTLEDLLADPNLSVYGDRTLAARVVALAREFELGEVVPLALYSIASYSFSDPPAPPSPLFTPINSPIVTAFNVPDQVPAPVIIAPQGQPLAVGIEGESPHSDPLGPSLTALSLINHTLPEPDVIRLQIGRQRLSEAAVSYLFQLREYGLMKISCSRKVGQYQRICAAGNVHAVWSRPQPAMAEFLRNPLGVMAIEGKAYDYSTMCGDCNAAGQAKHIELVGNLFARLPEIFMLSDVMVTA